jgi:hypothetical protein
MKNYFILIMTILGILFYTFVICELSDDVRFLRRKVSFLEEIQSKHAGFLSDIVDLLNKRY